ncbi:hypothetical protein M514_21736 [Trichuris suis]|uniref:J domain-containing protein n=1 Tax=Trichuris suis TaxID=68888 RepID=A0A085N9B4_9BILA|nr:hypothetical protein M514_21736 [Trichuris suis]
MASSSFEEECKRYFGSSCLYAVLGLEKSKNLTAKQVRQAYYNAVLAHHPDRCEGISKSEATEKFQLVSKAFAVLGNDEKRDMYFRTGRVDENDFCEEKCWIKYWRCFYKEVADSMLKPFAVVYRGTYFSNDCSIATSCESSSFCASRLHLKAAAAMFPTDLKKIIGDRTYRPKQAFNYDETALFWKKPNRAYIRKSAKRGPGFKAFEDRVTLVLCGSAAGRMIKPRVIYGAKNPRAINNKNKKHLPVFWQHNRNAWMAALLLTEWSHQCFIPEVKKYMQEQGLPFKVLLVVDNAPSYPDSIAHKNENVKVVFLPADTTSLLQPFDQAVTRIKATYTRLAFVIRAATDTNPDQSILDCWKSFAIADAIITFIKLAIDEPTPETVNIGWNKLWSEAANEFQEFEGTAAQLKAIVRTAKEISGEGLADILEEEVNELIKGNEEELTNEELDEVLISSAEEDEENQPEQASFPCNVQVIPYCSNEEALDVKKAYVKYKGDMNCIMESLIMSEIEDEPRYRRIINGLIEAGEVELYDDYANEPAEKATARREKASRYWARECKELQKRCAVDNPGTNFTSLPELFNARQREFDSGIFDVLLEKYRQTEQRKEVSERPTSSKAKWKSVDQPKLVKQESEKGVKIEASEVKRDSKRSTKKRRPYKASKEKERSRPEEDEQKNYARTIIRTRYRERITRQELEEQRNLQLRNKEKVTVQNNGLNGAGEHTERKREKRDNKRRKKSENKEDTPANRQTRSRAVRKSRKMGQKRVAKRKKESTDRQRSSRKTELQNGNYESQDEGKKMKLTISKKRGTKNARTSIQPTCSTSTSRKKRGQSMRITDEDVNDRSKHSSKFEKASGSKVNAGSRRSKRKRRRSRRWQT